MASYTYDFLELGEDHALGCKCCRFSRGIDLPIPKEQSITDITRLAATFSASILKDWTTLNAILKRFESSIHKRWLRKSSKQRHSILVQAWPDMPKTHRPDFIGFRNVGKTAPRSRTCPSNAFLWPYINLEDLQQRHLFLLFLNSRGRNFPDRFVSGDIASAHLGPGWDMDFEDDKKSVQFLGCRSPRSYGKVISSKGIKATTQTFHHHNPKRGLLALEIQHGIYSFLVSCTKLILHDISPCQFFLSPHQPEPPVPSPPTKEWPSLSHHMVEMPYRIPEKMDLEHLKVMVGARRSSAEDHIWLLREDPGYFVESLKEWKEHDEGFLKQKCECSWRAVAELMVGNVFSLYLYWHWIYQQLDRMSPLEEQIRRADHRVFRLQKKDETAWVELLNIVEAMMEMPLYSIFTGLPPSPRMRHCFNFAQPLDKRERPWDTKLGMSAAESRVEILFRTLCSHKDNEVHSLNHLVTEVQYMLDTDPKAGELVDSWIISHFSDLAMLSELRNRIVGLVPWSGAWYAKNLLKSESIVQRNNRLYGLEDRLRFAIREVFLEPSTMESLLGDPTSGGFEYPVMKRHTEENVKQMRLAERRLDAFWNAVDLGVSINAKISVPAFLQRRLLEPREIYRTPAWVPPVVEQAKAANPLQELNKNVPRFDSVGSTPDPITPVLSKTKIKTRGLPSSPVVDEHHQVNPDESGLAQVPKPGVQQIPVPKRAYRVLSVLLPDPSAMNQHRGEVSWDDFLQAMNLIGFQPQKLYGSVWIFMPRGTGEANLNRTGNRHPAPVDTRRMDAGAPTCLVDAKRSIQFHEPKEVRRGSKIPHHMARTFGRRLKHAYGWEGGMFVCE